MPCWVMGMFSEEVWCEYHEGYWATIDTERSGHLISDFPRLSASLSSSFRVFFKVSVLRKHTVGDIILLF